MFRAVRVSLRPALRISACKSRICRAFNLLAINLDAPCMERRVGMHRGRAAVQGITRQRISQMRQSRANLMPATAPNQFHFHQIMDAVNQSLLHLPAASTAFRRAALGGNGDLARTLVATDKVVTEAPHLSDAAHGQRQVRLACTGCTANRGA